MSAIKHFLFISILHGEAYKQIFIKCLSNFQRQIQPKWVGPWSMVNPSTNLHEHWSNTFWDILAINKLRWKHNLLAEVTRLQTWLLHVSMCTIYALHTHRHESLFTILSHLLTVTTPSCQCILTSPLDTTIQVYTAEYYFKNILSVFILLIHEHNVFKWSPQQSAEPSEKRNCDVIAI